MSGRDEVRILICVPSTNILRHFLRGQQIIVFFLGNLSWQYRLTKEWRTFRKKEIDVKRTFNKINEEKCWNTIRSVVSFLFFPQTEYSFVHY